jgi:uncharacterized protein
VFVRAKKSGAYQYLQLVHNQRIDGKVRQQVLATLGRLDLLQETGQIDGLIASCGRFAQHTAVLDAHGQGQTEAVATIKIGPVKATFKGNVTLSDLDPPNGYKISGQGDGGVAGFATGGATVKLEPKDGGTLLIYTVEAQIGGKLAQLGQRLVNGAAKKLADDFFQKFAATVSAAGA